MGRYRTLSLFCETNQDSEPPVFTLKPRDHNGLPSMKRLYLEYEDPTEYEFAIATLGSWEHWLKLSGADWFQKYITAWRDELEVKLRSKGVAKLKDQAASGNKDAAKWLAEKGWDKRQGAGRPTKREIEEEQQKRAKVASSLTDDAERIGLTSVKK
jgi:hypothetical protein